MKIPFFRRRRTLRGVLEQIIPKAEIDRLIRATPDRRHLLEAAAHLAGRPEMEVIRLVAEEFTCSVCETPIPTEIDVVAAQGGGLTIAEFRRLGVLPVVQRSEIVALVVVDPEVREVLPESFEGLPISIGSWERIARALHESEKLFRDRQELRALEEQRELDAAACAVLSTIISEADGFLSTEVTVAFTEQTVRYRFSTTDGRVASGEVSELIAPALKELLEGLAKGAHPTQIAFPIGWQRGAFQVLHDPVTESFIVSHRVREGVHPGILKPSDASRKIVPFPVVERSVALPAEAPPVQRILIVDDNPTFARVLERFFARNGVATAHAESGARAFELLGESSEPPHLIVCDVHMPFMNGVEFLRNFREQFSEIPVVMLTSDGDVELEIELLAAGADAFVRKQDDPRLLWVHVKRLLERRSAA